MVCFLFMYVNEFFIFIFFGKNKYIIRQEDNSVRIFNDINIVIWITEDEFWNLGNIIIINNNFIICSVMFVNMCGMTFCLP